MQKIFGRKPVLEALKSHSKIDQIYLQYGVHGRIIDEIKKHAKLNNVRLTQLSLQKFKSYGDYKSTQGVVGLKREYEYSEIDEILIEAENSVYPLILILDSIQDPHNLGAIIRTAECSGVDGIITTIRNSAAVNKT
ncbi:MAG: RNA methyltransferase substrate-binding domain-containing protein, partial [Melioribacteraceae bacterium]|nr:RNA methyltransferase substrate-binding domain-containing protein [Melioribacteraceae bacterium]